MRLHYVHDEACYVVRRPNGITLSVPAWMAEPATAEIRIVAVPRLPLDTLVELRLPGPFGIEPSAVPRTILLENLTRLTTRNPDEQ